MRTVSDEPSVCTDDGSYGRKAVVTEPLKDQARKDISCLGNRHNNDEVCLCNYKKNLMCTSTVVNLIR